MICSICCSQRELFASKPRPSPPPFILTSSTQEAFRLRCVRHDGQLRHKSKILCVVVVPLRGEAGDVAAPAPAMRCLWQATQFSKVSHISYLFISASILDASVRPQRAVMKKRRQEGGAAVLLGQPPRCFSLRPPCKYVDYRTSDLSSNQGIVSRASKTERQEPERIYTLTYPLNLGTARGD